MPEILHFHQLDSTNNYAKEQIQQLEHFTVVSCDRQVQGKGRLGKGWITQPGNVAMSIVCKNQTGEVSLFPLLCGLGVARVLERLTGQRLEIKWPNDVLICGKKLCGILCESLISSSQIHIICGIGINVNLGKEQFEQAALPYATSLQIETGQTFDTRQIVLLITQEMKQILEQFQKQGFSAFREEYTSRLVNCGKEVKVVYQNDTIIAQAIGIAENGNLICNYQGKEILIHSGEASVRGLYGYV